MHAHVSCRKCANSASPQDGTTRLTHEPPCVGSLRETCHHKTFCGDRYKQLRNNVNIYQQRNACMVRFKTCMSSTCLKSMESCTQMRLRSAGRLLLSNYSNSAAAQFLADGPTNPKNRRLWRFVPPPDSRTLNLSSAAFNNFRLFSLNLPQRNDEQHYGRNFLHRVKQTYAMTNSFPRHYYVN